MQRWEYFLGGMIHMLLNLYPYGVAGLLVIYFRGDTLDWLRKLTD